MLQVSGGLLAAGDRREGVTLYRYWEPVAPAGTTAAQLAPRGRLARRYRLAPPGAAELRHRLGLQHVLLRGAPQEGGAAGEGGAPEEEPEPGFTVVAADACCRAAVGALALPPAPGGPAPAASSAAAAAAVLDASGQLTVLQQRWPQREPALHQRCAFRLGEPAVALLPASLAYRSDTDSSLGGGSGAPAALAPAGQPAPAAEMVAVTAGGGVVALQPLAQDEARQLLALQRALAAHPATAPLGGGAHAAFRGPDSGPVPSPPLTFRHPPPPGVDPTAFVDLLATPPLDTSLAAAAPAAAATAAGPGPFPPATVPAAVAAEPAAPRPVGEAEAGPPGSSSTPPAVPAPTPAPPEVDAVLDGDLLQAFLLLPPAEQRVLLASLASSGGSAAIDTSDLRVAARRLTGLVARLLL